jgi:GT2 family glycosyltransferase
VTSSFDRFQNNNVSAQHPGKALVSPRSGHPPQQILLSSGNNNTGGAGGNNLMPIQLKNENKIQLNSTKNITASSFNF